ncbi:hypothetical protein HanRHA438_Chr12g0561601 [Helianthus annuus]|nr:hypothetical protein HanRHA438_Chr12g0561601 [Helianthus annuus]
MNNTHALDMLPYSLSTCLVALIFCSSSPSLSSTWSSIAGPPGCAIQKIVFQSSIPSGENACARAFSMLLAINPGTSLSK